MFIIKMFSFKQLLSYIFIAFLISSCSSKQSDPGPDTSVLAGHQAPFGTDTVPVKIRKILSDNQLVGEFLYVDGYVSEHKRYLKNYTKQTQYSAAVFKRRNGFPLSYEVKVADYVPETQFISSNFLTRNILLFETPANNSTHEVSEDWPQLYNQFLRKFLFDRQGLIVQQDVTVQNSNNNRYITTYIRDAAGNVTSSFNTKVSDSGKTNRREYEYDNRNSPFFKMGIDWQGDVSAHTFGRNNITRETIYNDNGGSSVITYKYTYLANGYPDKVIITTDNGTPENLVFSY